MENGKSLGENGIPLEVLKSCLSVLLSPLTKLFRRIRDSGFSSRDWRISNLLHLTKRDYKTTCVNYGGINLIDVTGVCCDYSAKLFYCLGRASMFCSVFSLLMNNLCLLNLYDTSKYRISVKFQHPAATCLIDFGAAFNSFGRWSLQNILRSGAMPEKCVRLLGACYSVTQVRVRAYSGVHQSCCLSLVLFSDVMNCDYASRNSPPYVIVGNRVMSNRLCFTFLPNSNAIAYLGF